MQAIVRQNEATAVELALIEGDLSRLTPEQCVSYYQQTCQSLGLNPLTKPFEYLRLNGKKVLYATRNCTDQLRKVHGVSLAILSRESVDDILCVVARATTRDGRCEESLGAVPTAGLKGEAKANALMKAETKAKRRVTLSICGLSLLDESELDGVPQARREAPAQSAVHAELLAKPPSNPIAAEVPLGPEAERIAERIADAQSMQALVAISEESRGLELAQYERAHITAIGNARAKALKEGTNV